MDYLRSYSVTVERITIPQGPAYRVIITDHAMGDTAYQRDYLASATEVASADAAVIDLLTRVSPLWTD